MGWGRRLVAATTLMSIGSVAVAQPAANPSYVPVSAAPASQGDSSAVVEPGDHLWKISEEHLARVLGRPASDDEVDPYWRSVIERNEGLLASGDPDLIYPGETVTLPPTG